MNGGIVIRFSSVLLLIILVILLALPILAQNGFNVAYLSPGWDRSDPISKGEVSWMDQAGEFSVMFELQGAKPNQNYTVGAHFFNPNNLTRYPYIDSFLGWFIDKAIINREGTTAATEAWDFGYLETDQNGKGKAEFRGYVPDGLYYAQFTAKIGSGCSPNEGQTDGCDVVYCTGNGFADGLEKLAIGGYKEMDGNSRLNEISGSNFAIEALEENETAGSTIATGVLTDSCSATNAPHSNLTNQTTGSVSGSESEGGSGSKPGKGK